MQGFGIFEGGGAKGLAHIGALRAAENVGIEFFGVAGTSAGAIVAALIAAGYRACELYDPESSSGLFCEKDLLEFFDTKLLRMLMRFWTDLRDWRLSRNRLFRLVGLYLKHKSLVELIIDRHGVFDTRPISDWLQEKIAAKTNINKTTFEDLRKASIRNAPKTLKIIATDYARAKIRIFGTEESPDVMIADAVAASIAIPFLFVPKNVNGRLLVDGGVVSGFPAWAFDKERSLNPDVHTFGFRLVDALSSRKTTEPPPRRTNGDGIKSHVVLSGDASVAKVGQFADVMDEPISQFGMRILTACLSGNSSLHVRQIQNLHVIPIPVSVGTLSLEFYGKEKDQPFLEGFHAATEFFGKRVLPLDDAKARELLNLFVRCVSGALWNSIKQTTMGSRPAELRSIRESSQIHLRANVALPIVKSLDEEGQPHDIFLKIIHTWGMDGDADDDLEFPRNAGAIGRCWVMKCPILCDLKDAQLTFEQRWNLTKYQQRLVRGSLASLLSVPVLKDNGEPVAVLTFDSDLPLLKYFADSDVQKVVENCANALSGSMRRL